MSDIEQEYQLKNQMTVSLKIFGELLKRTEVCRLSIIDMKLISNQFWGLHKVNISKETG
jgi:hypothetical protein